MSKVTRAKTLHQGQFSRLFKITQATSMWYVLLAKSMAISLAIVFAPAVLLLVISAFANGACWAFGGQWCSP